MFFPEKLLVSFPCLVCSGIVAENANQRRLIMLCCPEALKPFISQKFTAKDRVQAYLSLTITRLNILSRFVHHKTIYKYLI